MSALLDTHAAIFLWEGRHELFGPAAREVLETEELLLSPFSRLEMAYLHEIGRILVDPDTILGGLEADCAVSLTRDRVAEVVASAMRLSWTRDPFDRILVGTAMTLGVRMVTRDRVILENFAGAVW